MGICSPDGIAGGLLEGRAHVLGSDHGHLLLALAEGFEKLLDRHQELGILFSALHVGRKLSLTEHGLNVL